jgi:hypothetical protein
MTNVAGLLEHGDCFGKISPTRKDVSESSITVDQRTSEFPVGSDDALGCLQEARFGRIELIELCLHTAESDELAGGQLFGGGLALFRNCERAGSLAPILCPGSR